MADEEEQQIIKMPISASVHIMYALTIFQTINEDGVYSLRTSYIGDPPQAAKVGLLQAVLDFERDKMRRQWRTSIE